MREKEKKPEFVLEGEEREKKEPNWEINKIIKCKATVIMHIYTKFGYLQSFTCSDASVICAMLCKFLHFLCFAMTDAIALSGFVYWV